jgi:hypothetical protein
MHCFINIFLCQKAIAMNLNNFKNRLVFLLLFSIFWNSNTIAQNTDSCSCSLKIQNDTVTLHENFWKIFSKLNNQSIIDDQRLSAFYLFNSYPYLLSYYLGNDIACNAKRVHFLNESICDTSVKIILTYFKKPIKNFDTIEVFDKTLFDKSVFDIRDSAYVALKKAYPWFKIYIDVSGLSRSLKEQEKYYKSGSSTTLLSAHNLGAAADFTIYFNGYMINPAPREYSIYNSIEPYQILGKCILDKGYFWGIPWDPGHMQIIRKTNDLLIKYPEFQENANVISFYVELMKRDSVPLKYKPAVEILDKKFYITKTWIYDESKPWVEDSLIKPIAVDSNFRSKYFR